MDSDSNRDLERLNALVDGELSPAEHAAVAARIASTRDFAKAHATLARLKAHVVASADADAALAAPLPKRRSFARVAGLAAVAAAVALLTAGNIVSERPANTAAREAAIIQAALPVAPIIPDLGSAGLALSGMAVERLGETSVLVASYRGPRGCRLELRIRPVNAVVTPIEGTIRQAWVSGDLAYELTAFGMPTGRFALVSEAAKDATRSGHSPEIVEGRLREARVGAPPCIG